jgi:hypothetical protein
LPRTGISRRTLALLFAPLAAPPTGQADAHITIDDVDLNAFAQAYNTYVELLRRGIADVKQWERVRRAWRRLDAC